MPKPWLQTSVRTSDRHQMYWQVVCGGDATAEDLADVEEGNDYVVANKREFFHATWPHFRCQAVE